MTQLAAVLAMQDPVVVGKLLAVHSEQIVLLLAFKQLGIVFLKHLPFDPTVNEALQVEQILELVTFRQFLSLLDMQVVPEVLGRYPLKHLEQVVGVARIAHCEIEAVMQLFDSSGSLPAPQVLAGTATDPLNTYPSDGVTQVLASDTTSQLVSEDDVQPPEVFTMKVGLHESHSVVES
jgi:hypothetical protein